MTPEEFDAEFSKPHTLRSRFWCWYYNTCQTCRGQQYSSKTNTLCPTCGGKAWPFNPNRKSRYFFG